MRNFPRYCAARVTKALFLVALTGALALGVAACAPARTETARTPPVPASSGPPGGGVIVSMRPMTVAASDTILIALNEGATTRGARPAEVEFIIREDGGRTVSVVQADAAGFRPGERVMLIGGARTRVTPVGG
jgi:hypothetical protein